jgi:hypothetical protein
MKNIIIGIIMGVTISATVFIPILDSQKKKENGIRKAFWIHRWSFGCHRIPRQKFH